MAAHMSAGHHLPTIGRGDACGKAVPAPMFSTRQTVATSCFVVSVVPDWEQRRLHCGGAHHASSTSRRRNERRQLLPLRCAAGPRRSHATLRGGQATCLPPFFLGTGIHAPVRSASAQIHFSHVSSVASKVRHTRSHVPSANQRSSRRQQVLDTPYCFGRSRQRQPVRSTYKIPLSVRRSSARGRPRYSGVGNSGWISAHWASVKSLFMDSLSPLKGSCNIRLDACYFRNASYNRTSVCRVASTFHGLAFYSHDSGSNCDHMTIALCSISYLPHRRYHVSRRVPVFPVTVRPLHT